MRVYTLIPALFLGVALSAVSLAHAQTNPTTLLESRLSETENVIRQLNGRLEQLEFQNKQLKQQVERAQSDDNVRFQNLEQGIAQLRVTPAPVAANDPEVLEETTAPAPAHHATNAGRKSSTPAAADTEDDDALVKASPTEANGTLGNLRVQGDKIVGADASGKSTPLPKKPDDYGLTAQEQYDRAFSLLRQAKYDEAEIAFKKFLKKNPADKMANSAKYWLGETYYVREKFSDAAVTFAETYEAAPTGPKAPDSLLKMAMSLRELNSTADACTTLASLRKKYPNASASVKARADEEWKALNCFNKTSNSKTAAGKPAKPKAE